MIIIIRISIVICRYLLHLLLDLILQIVVPSEGLRVVMIEGATIMRKQYFGWRRHIRPCRVFIEL